MTYVLAYLLLTLAGFLFAAEETIVYRYSRRVWIGIDQFINAVIGGNEDHTISGRAGRGRRQGSAFWRITANVIDWIFRDNQHCRDAIEHNERKVEYNYPLLMLAIYSASGLFSVFVLGLLLKSWAS